MGYCLSARKVEGEATLTPILSTSSPSCVALWATLNSFFLPVPAHSLSLGSSQTFTFLSYPSHSSAGPGLEAALLTHTHTPHTHTHPDPSYTSHPHHSDHCTSLVHFQYSNMCVTGLAGWAKAWDTEHLLSLQSLCGGKRAGESSQERGSWPAFFPAPPGPRMRGVMGSDSMGQMRPPAHSFLCNVQEHSQLCCRE